MKNKLNPKKAIALVGALVILVVGGYFLGQYLIGEKEDGAAAAAVVSPDISPSTPAEATPHIEIDRLPDGIVGVDVTPATEAEDDNQDTPSPLPSLPVGGNNSTSGSSGGSSPPAPGTGSGTASTTPPATTPAPSANPGNGSTPAAGSTNESGQFYDPVFGWVTPTGGQSIPSSGNDGDWNKQVGTMG